MTKKIARDPKKGSNKIKDNFAVMAIVLLMLGLLGGYAVSMLYNPLATELKDDREELSFQLEELHRRYNSRENELSRLSEETSTLEARLDSLTSASEQLRFDAAALEMRIYDLGEEKALLETSLVLEEEERLALLDDLQTITGSLEEAVRDLAASQIQILSLDSEVFNLTSELDSLRKTYDSVLNRFKIAPQARPEFNIVDDDGFFFWLTPGTAREQFGIGGPEDAYVLVRVPDPTECMGVSGVAGSGSMRPLFAGGHEVIVNTCWEIGDINVGDIVAYRRFGIGIVHQVIEVRVEGVITQGIANEMDDGLVRWDSIRGIVVAIVY